MPREAEIHYLSPKHIQEILKNGGIKEKAREWSKLLGRKVRPIMDKDKLIIKR